MTLLIITTIVGVIALSGFLVCSWLAVDSMSRTKKVLKEFNNLKNKEI